MQQYQARQNYLQAEVQTATPQKLQLLLIEAAIKNIHRTKLAWKDKKYDDGFETLSRSQDIIAEILSSLDTKNSSIGKQLASIYVFIFRRLAEGGMSHEEQKLDDALRVLESERETWRLVCEKFGSSAPASATSNASSFGDSATFTSSAEADPGKARLLVQPGQPSATFSRPTGIQTDASLASPPPNPPAPVASPTSSGHNWEA